MCVCFSFFFLSFFSFLVSILYVNVRNALIKKKEQIKKEVNSSQGEIFHRENFLGNQGGGMKMTRFLPIA